VMLRRVHRHVVGPIRSWNEEVTSKTSSVAQSTAPPPELLFTAAVFGPPAHPATTWGGTGPKRTVPSSSFHPDQSQPPEPPVLAGKCKNPTEFNPKFKELDLPPPAAISGDQIVRS
ncbi:organic cation/carnitine transporter 3, partial [Prunus dulcis]